MKNVLFLNPTAQIGGAEKSLLSLVDILQKSDYRLYAALPFNGPLCDELKRRNVMLIKLPISKIFFQASRTHNSLSSFFSFTIHLIPVCIHLITLIHKYSISVVHSNGIKMHIVSALSGFYPRCRLIWHVRDIFTPGITRSVFSVLCLFFPDLVITNSNATASAIKKCRIFSIFPVINPGKFQILYNPVSLPEKPAENRNNTRKTLSILPESFVVISIGHIVPLKGYHILLNAFREFLKHYPDSHLIIAGDNIYKTNAAYDHYYTKLKEYSLRKDCRGKIHFLGNRNDIKDLLACSDLSVLSSFSEGFGRTNIEALIMNVPVISTNIGGIPETVSNNKHGILIPPGNSRLLAEKLCYARSHMDEMKQMAEAGKSYVSTTFSPDVLKEKTLHIYKKILKN